MLEVALWSIYYSERSESYQGSETECQQCKKSAQVSLIS
jgi:hypothetical protein